LFNPTLAGTQQRNLARMLAGAIGECCIGMLAAKR
jgi:hypothetical protein